VPIYLPPASWGGQPRPALSKITVQNIEKSYGGEELFSALSFEALPGMRLAVAGPNGSGKSTLLKILAGRAEPDKGSVVLTKAARIGYVAQELSGADLVEPLLGWVLAALPNWGDFWREWEHAVAAHDEVRLRKLGERQARLESQFGYHPEHKARAILSGLGFSDDDLSRKLEWLSGGWRERAKLARVLLQGADILLLDEPTNHLDLEAVEWLEDYLLNFKGTLIYVAHDRIFLERVGTHVLVLGTPSPCCPSSAISGLAGRGRRTAPARAANLSRASARAVFIRRFRVKARKAAQAQSKIKRVEKVQDELSRLKGDQLAARRRRPSACPSPARRQGSGERGRLGSLRASGPASAALSWVFGAARSLGRQRRGQVNPAQGAHRRAGRQPRLRQARQQHDSRLLQPAPDRDPAAHKHGHCGDAPPLGPQVH
jgi:ATP-binding cassette subfamily F protein 3